MSITSKMIKRYQKLKAKSEEYDGALSIYEMQEIEKQLNSF